MKTLGALTASPGRGTHDHQKLSGRREQDVRHQRTQGHTAASFCSDIGRLSPQPPARDRAGLQRLKTRRFSKQPSTTSFCGGLERGEQGTGTWPESTCTTVGTAHRWRSPSSLIPVGWFKPPQLRTSLTQGHGTKDSQEGDKPHTEEGPPGGAGTAHTVRMASVQPQSLKGLTGEGGRGGQRFFGNSADGWGRASEGGQVWNSLQVEKGRNSPWCPLPTRPRPGECQLPQPALVAAGDQTFHFGHLLGRLPLLHMRRALPLG